MSVKTRYACRQDLVRRVVVAIGLAGLMAASPVQAADLDPAQSCGPNVPNPDAIAAVEAGARTVANAAWWGFGADDATNAVQDAIDSGAATVVVPFVEADWVVRPIRLRSNLELVFEPGVVITAKPGAFKGRGDSLFSVNDAENITIRGYGATLRMRKADYQSDAYEAAEWRMTLDIQGCRHVRIEGVRLESSGGDGIYLGATEALPYCEDVVIRDVVCHDHHRQGISVISAVDLLIENCLLSGTDGTAPEAGIDLEPNLPNERMHNVVVRNCVMSNNSGAGILVYLKPLTRESEPVSILFDNCLVSGGEDTGIGVGAVKDDGPGGLIEFRNCTIHGSKRGGIYVYDKSPLAARVRFVGCKWRGVGMGDYKDPSTHPPLLLHLRRRGLATSLGGIDFVDCHVYDTEDRPVLRIEGREGDHAARDVQGTIHVSNPHGARMDVKLPSDDIGVELLAD